MSASETVPVGEESVESRVGISWEGEVSGRWSWAGTIVVMVGVADGRRSRGDMIGDNKGCTLVTVQPGEEDENGSIPERLVVADMDNGVAPRLM